MELPFIITTGEKIKVEQYENQELTAHQHVIKVPEDIEKLPAPLLAQIYNQANPGTNVNAFKPGTVIKYVMPSLGKIAAASAPKAAAAPASAGKSENDKGDDVAQEGQPKEKKPAAPRKRDVPDKYRKGDKELAMRDGSIRKQAYDTALNEPDKLTPKLKGVVSWLVRVGVLVREA